VADGEFDAFTRTMEVSPWRGSGPRCRLIEEHNQEPKPFVWKKDPDDIAAVKRGFQTNPL
jgi:hypothetical protein